MRGRSFTMFTCVKRGQCPANVFADDSITMKSIWAAGWALPGTMTPGKRRWRHILPDCHCMRGGHFTMGVSVGSVSLMKSWPGGNGVGQGFLGWEWITGWFHEPDMYAVYLMNLIWILCCGLGSSMVWSWIWFLLFFLYECIEEGQYAYYFKHLTLTLCDISLV